MDATARSWLRKVDVANNHLSSAILESLSDDISNHSTYSLRDDWPDLKAFCFQSGRLPPMFALLRESDKKAVNVAPPRLPVVEVTDIDSHGKVVM